MSNSYYFLRCVQSPIKFKRIQANTSQLGTVKIQYFEKKLLHGSDKNCQIEVKVVSTVYSANDKNDSNLTLIAHCLNINLGCTSC